MYSEIPDANPTVVRLRISGKVTERDYKQICRLLRQRLEQTRTVDLLCELDESFTRVSLPVLWQSALVASSKEIQLQRIAVIGVRAGYKWARALVRSFHAETRYFDPAHRTRALRWLEKGPAYPDAQRPQKFAGDANYRIQRNGRSSRAGKTK